MFTISGMLFLEVSLMAFLLQGNYASGQEALTRTFGISGIIVGVDIFLKVLSSMMLKYSLSLSLSHYTILDSHIKNLDTSRILGFCFFSMLF